MDSIHAWIIVLAWMSAPLLSVQNQAVIINSFINKFLQNKQIEKFDIIFLDPPFLHNNFIEELKILKEKKIYNNNHVIIIHRERDSNDDFKKIVNPFITKVYGRSKIIFAKF